MYIKSTIVITDPCYMKNNKSALLMERSTIYGDWSCMTYPGTIQENKNLTEQWNQKYLDFFNKFNFKPNTTDEERKSILEDFQNFKSTWKSQNNILGEFCADAGMVGVFDYDKLSDENKKFIETHNHCATVIPDFDGTVEFVVDNEEVHVIGKGNKNFFTCQSGF